MNHLQRLHIQVLPRSSEPELEQRESGILHTPYAVEESSMHLIEKRDLESIQQMAEHFLSSSIVVGHLSDNSIRQMQYWAVCCITLGIRSAIRGGLDEMTAFNLSDRCIMQIDQLQTPEQILSLLEHALTDLVQRVRYNKAARYPQAITVCMDYVERHLHERITTDELAGLAHFSPDYFTRYFKKHVRKTPARYIQDRKLKYACELLKNGKPQRMIAYDLGFCSQSYFITCFKKTYGVTPQQYLNRK